jgi:outer membrane protein OmpA-like peptidoglycan-associated protein
VLAPPASAPEKFGERDDFPYLGKPAGAVLAGSSTVDEPLDVTQAGDSAPQLVGQRHWVKRYTPPASLSKLEFEAQYRAALEAAGWKVRALAVGVKPGEGVVVAQFVARGRNLWAQLGRGNDNSDSGLVMKVADIGAADWAGDLDKRCRVPLYGVNFDTDKASLRPEATPLLEKARDALKSRPTMKVAVQGHTDNVGSDAHNQQLSAARAETVRAWLAAHGIEAARLASRGFGKTAPVADNGSELGRARNRRVELVREGCTP